MLPRICRFDHDAAATFRARDVEISHESMFIDDLAAMIAVHQENEKILKIGSNEIGLRLEKRHCFQTVRRRGACLGQQVLDQGHRGAQRSCVLEKRYGLDTPLLPPAGEMILQILSPPL